MPQAAIQHAEGSQRFPLLVSTLPKFIDRLHRWQNSADEWREQPGELLAHREFDEPLAAAFSMPVWL